MPKNSDRLIVWWSLSPLILLVAYFAYLFASNRFFPGGFAGGHYIWGLGVQVALFWAIQRNTGTLGWYWPVLANSLVVLFLAFMLLITGGDFWILTENLFFVVLGYVALLFVKFSALSSRKEKFLTGSVWAGMLLLLVVFGADIKRLTVGKAAQVGQVDTAALQGKPLPVNLTNAAGEVVPLSAFEGKVLVVDFWATWCKPCLLAFPHFEKTYHELKDDPQVLMLSVNCLTGGDTRQKATKFMEKKGAEVPMYFDEGNTILDSLGINSIPTLIITDKNGLISFVQVGFSSPEAYYKTLKQEIARAVALAKQGEKPEGRAVTGPYSP